MDSPGSQVKYTNKIITFLHGIISVNFLKKRNLIDEAILPERDPSHSEVELMHTLPQRKQISVHRNLHDGLPVDLDDQAPALLLH